jgi:hypothetical protein
MSERICNSYAELEQAMAPHPVPHGAHDRHLVLLFVPISAYRIKQAYCQITL